MNAAHARHLEVRRLLLIGRLDEAVPAEDFVNIELFADAMANLQ